MQAETKNAIFVYPLTLVFQSGPTYTELFSYCSNAAGLIVLATAQGHLLWYPFGLVLLN